ncbi:hypothetical protein Tco_0499604, partial [Tanacetum coccineum]
WDPKTHDLGSCGEDGDVVEVPETLFEEERHSNDIQFEENMNPKENHSKDLFGIYSLLNKKKATIGEDGPSDQSPIYPPGFTPFATINEPCTNTENDDNVNCSLQEGLFTSVADHNAGPVRNSASQESMRDASESVCSGHFKKSVTPHHRPMLLRESRFDYGPSPFCFYHHWLEVDGFNNFVEDMWSVAPGNNSNPLCSMAMKLKFLKLKIKEWNQRNMKDLTIAVKASLRKI